ncbi:UNVERIFIED_CONTAM: hypothetical protein K2H54_031466 [Gekko kuhli]
MLSKYTSCKVNVKMRRGVGVENQHKRERCLALSVSASSPLQVPLRPLPPTPKSGSFWSRSLAERKTVRKKTRGAFVVGAQQAKRSQALISRPCKFLTPGIRVSRGT